MNIARQYQLMQAKKRANKHPAPPKPDPLVVARDAVRSLEIKVRTKDDEIARLTRELLKARRK